MNENDLIFCSRRCGFNTRDVISLRKRTQLETQLFFSLATVREKNRNSSAISRQEMEILDELQPRKMRERIVRKVTTLLGFYDTRSQVGITLFDGILSALGASGVSLTLYSSVSCGSKVTLFVF